MKLRSEVYKEGPKHGDRRTVVKFALFPVWVWDEKEEHRYLIWMEDYIQRQTYLVEDDFDCECGWTSDGNYLKS